jgi:hypothetical protein
VGSKCLESLVYTYHKLRYLGLEDKNMIFTSVETPYVFFYITAFLLKPSARDACKRTAEEGTSATYGLNIRTWLNNRLHRAEFETI